MYTFSHANIIYQMWLHVQDIELIIAGRLIHYGVKIIKLNHALPTILQHQISTQMGRACVDLLNLRVRGKYWLRSRILHHYPPTTAAIII